MTYDPNASFGMYKKIKIHFSLDENRELIPLLTRKDLKYSQSSILKHKLKYYETGTSFMRTPEFKRAGTHTHQFETINNFVLLFGVNKDVEPDGKRFIRIGRRTVIPFGALFQSIEHQGVFYKEFPVTADLKDVDISTVEIDLNTANVTITAHVPQAFAMIESPIDYAGHMTNQIAPIIDALKDIRSKVDIDLYSSSLGQSEILRAMLLMFSNFRLIRGVNTDNTRAVRLRLIEALVENDIIELDHSAENKVNLIPNDNADPINDNTISHHLYEVDGAYFKDKIAFESALACKDMYRDTSYEDFIQAQKDANRAEWLTQHCTFNELLKSMTRAEIERKGSPHLGCWLIMTKDEQDVYFDYEKNDHFEGMRRIELQAIDRWKAFNGLV